MRAGPPEDPLTTEGFAIHDGVREGCWNVMRPIDHAWPKKGWGTPFTGFRMAVPELMGFEGRAIYLDADMLVLGDIQKLYEHEKVAPWLCNPVNRTDVSVIECAAFKDLQGWPSISQMQRGVHLSPFRAWLRQQRLMDESLPWSWNDCEGKLFQEGKESHLIHFTSVPHQPYKPYPSIQYRKHPHDKAVAEWQKWHQMAG